MEQISELFSTASSSMSLCGRWRWRAICGHCLAWPRCSWKPNLLYWMSRPTTFGYWVIAWLETGSGQLWVFSHCQPRPVFPTRSQPLPDLTKHSLTAILITPALLSKKNRSCWPEAKNYEKQQRNRCAGRANRNLRASTQQASPVSAQAVGKWSVFQTQAGSCGTKFAPYDLPFR